MNECKERDACAAVSESRANLARNNPELAAMRARLERDAFSRLGALSTVKKHLVTIAALTALRAVGNVREKTEAALADGVSPVQIREAVYQCAPYAGFPATEDAMREVDAAFSARGIALPLEHQATVTEENRFEKGLYVQKGIFGDVIDAMHASAPEGQKAIMVDHLSAFCFGDIYTRRGLDLKTRELLTFSIISALGGCEAQVKSHVQGNANVGNAKQELIDALEVCLPLMGFPRTLNALSCVNAVMPD